ncbi:MAG: hypothetical protein AW12_01121 [Candidatus Accumulibacter sp. BA-94]|nr:MAG: hypothetical protein AW12_01121 [Candidatus Accumulibacter sp. BA-94]
MSKEIVVCLDGSWNDPVERTNAYRLFQMLPGTERQVVESGPIRSHLVRTGEQLAASSSSPPSTSPASAAAAARRACCAGRRESACTTA